MWGLIGLGLAAAGTVAQYLSARKAKSAAESAYTKNRQTAQLHDALGGNWQRMLLEQRQGQLNAEGQQGRDAYAGLVQRMTQSPDGARSAVAADKAEREAAIGPRATFGADEFGQVASESKAKTDRLDQTADASADAAAAFRKMGRQDATLAAGNNLGDTLRGILSRRSTEDYTKRQMEQEALMQILMQMTGQQADGSSNAAANLQLLGGLLNTGSSAAFGYGAMEPTDANAASLGLSPQFLHTSGGAVR
jgi:hypothetical protein